MVQKLHPDAINSLVYGNHGAPFDILGPHLSDDNTLIVRTFNPTAESIHLVNKSTKKRTKMKKIHDKGLFEVSIPNPTDDFKYSYEVTLDEKKEIIHDPYSFSPFLTEYDLYLLGEGQHWESYDKLGSHLDQIDGVDGTRFAVWAPNAYRVSIIGDFNNWDSRIHPMRRHESGIWELFIPGVAEYHKYKYDIHSNHMAYQAEKTDPHGFFCEMRPNTASIVTDLDKYQWNDDEWMEQRNHINPLDMPMNTYEVHLGSWRRKNDFEWLTYHDLVDQLIPYVKEMGYTHIELLPIAEHPLDQSWGYQVTGYYAVTSRFGTPEDFMYFIDQCHQNNIGVILDWVPAHFPKDGFALSYFDGTHLYEHEDSRKGEHPDWGTYIFNYGRNEVRNFLISNALFWLKKYHIDGLRVDAVSSMLYLNFGREDGEWLPNEHGGHENLEAIQFMQQTNTLIHEHYPGAVTIAEESTSWPMVSRPTYIGGLGFTFKWNMGWMHDTLDYIAKDPIYRRYHHNNLTFSLMYAFSENFVLSLSHDEVVHLKGSMINKIAGDWWQKFATLRLLMGYQMTHPGKKLLFMGQEFGQWSEWNESGALDWSLLDFPMHKKVQQWSKDINHFYKEEPALYELDFNPEGFQWIEANDADHSVFSYMRFGKDRNNFIVVVCNFTPVVYQKYRIGVPSEGYYKELFNSDSELYGGSNVGNEGGIWAKPSQHHGQPHSIDLTIPPLGMVILKKQ